MPPLAETIAIGIPWDILCSMSGTMVYEIHEIVGIYRNGNVYDLNSKGYIRGYIGLWLLGNLGMDQ